jgi:hypothetical protein
MSAVVFPDLERVHAALSRSLSNETQIIDRLRVLLSIDASTRDPELRSALVKLDQSYQHLASLQEQLEHLQHQLLGVIDEQHVAHLRDQAHQHLVASSSLPTDASSFKALEQALGEALEKHQQIATTQQHFLQAQQQFLGQVQHLHQSLDSWLQRATTEPPATTAVATSPTATSSSSSSCTTANVSDAQQPITCSTTEHSDQQASHSVTGSWAPGSDGGCMNIATWRCNTQYRLVVARSANVCITLKQLPKPGASNEGIGFYVLNAPCMPRHNATHSNGSRVRACVCDC